MPKPRPCWPSAPISMTASSACRERLSRPPARLPVVILNLIGDQGRGEAFRKTLATSTAPTARRRSAWTSRRAGQLSEKTKKPWPRLCRRAADCGFYLWHADTHPDHVAASAICHAACASAAGCLAQRDVRARRYLYDNGPITPSASSRHVRQR